MAGHSVACSTLRAAVPRVGSILSNAEQRPPSILRGKGFPAELHITAERNRSGSRRQRHGLKHRREEHHAEAASPRLLEWLLAMRAAHWPINERRPVASTGIVAGLGASGAEEHHWEFCRRHARPDRPTRPADRELQCPTPEQTTETVA